MQENTEISIFQPPKQLMSGFLDFAKEVHRQSLDKGGKLAEEELAEIFNSTFSGQVRATFFLWIGDLNKIIDVVNIVLSDLSELRKDKNSLKGNPVRRSEFLLQAFFGEFFRIREISKIFIKYLNKVEVLDNKHKETFVEFYFTAFDWVYEVRNRMVHLGVNLKEEGINIDYSFLNDLDNGEKQKFISLIQESNTRENTVEIQCAIYIKLIITVMNHYFSFQQTLNNVLADLIISFEKLNLSITVSKNDV
ncbi:MAG: hypothetical protein WC716_04325 [Chitinophagaceae bacterium]|jgi:hypothetical protein